MSHSTTTNDAVLTQILTQLEHLTLSQQVLQAKVRLLLDLLHTSLNSSYTPLLVVSNVSLTFSPFDSSMLSRPSRRHPPRRHPARPRSLSHTAIALPPYHSPVPSPTLRSSPRRLRHPPLVSRRLEHSLVDSPPRPSSKIEKRSCIPRGSS